MTGAIRYTCRTPNCEGTCSFSSDTFLPNGREWTCPACEDALERQMADDLYQEQLARKLVALAEDKERENQRTLTIIPRTGPVTVECGDGRIVTVPVGGTFTTKQPKENF